MLRNYALQNIHMYESNQQIICICSSKIERKHIKKSHIHVCTLRYPLTSKRGYTLEHVLRLQNEKTNIFNEQNVKLLKCIKNARIKC